MLRSLTVPQRRRPFKNDCGAALWLDTPVGPGRAARARYQVLPGLLAVMRAPRHRAGELRDADAGECKRFERIQISPSPEV